MNAAMAVIGREAVLGQCRQQLAESGSVLLHGPAGIGKSTLVEALCQGFDGLVLRASPVTAEAGMPWLTLYDLFRDILPDADRLLPQHLASTLTAALLHGPPDPDSGVDPICLRIGVVELLRALAGSRPVLIVADDTQWIDPPSAEVLAFAARRLSGVRVAMLAAERVDADGMPTSSALCRTPALDLAVAGLSERDLGLLLRRKLLQRLDDTTLHRVAAAAGGNPLFALELGRAIAQHGTGLRPEDPLPVPPRLRDLLASRLAALDDATRSELLVLAAGGEVCDRHAAQSALDAGVLIRRADGVGFSHPLLSEVVYAEAADADRRAAHAAIATAATDPVTRARQRALAADGPDADLASALDDAAGAACRRGSPGLAAELARMAAQRTPHEPDRAARRLLDAARFSYAAGLVTDTRVYCRQVLESADAQDRVAARLLLVDLDPDGDASPGLLAEAAVDAADHPRQLAQVFLYQTERAIRSGDQAGCLENLRRAEALAAGDPELTLQILSVRGPLELSADGDKAQQSYQDGVRVASGRPLTEAAVYVRAGLAVAQLRTGQTAEAIDGLETLRGDVERAGRLHELGDVLQVLTTAYERAGRCGQAYATGLAGARLREDLDPDVAKALLLRGLAELNGGTADAAAAALQTAADVRQTGAENHAYVLGHLGRARLLQGATEAAADMFGQARAALDALGFADPGLCLIDADLVESLARTGEAEQAANALADAWTRARRPDRIVLHLGLKRAAATLESVTGDARTAAATLRETLERHADHAYPLEVARGWLALGSIETRARRQAAARAAMSEAARRYALHSCRPWLHFTQAAISELDHQDQPVTDIERGIAAMVRAGASNKEIARKLHLSVKTVEAHLTRLYRKRGIRSRAELAGE